MREALAEILRQDFAPNSRILDYGCGTGQFLLLLSKFGFSNLHGWDQNERWLIAARELFRRLDFGNRCEFKTIARSVIYDIRSDSGNFDIISMFGLIYGHKIEIERVFKSVHDALNSGGLFVVNDHIHSSSIIRSLIKESNLQLNRTISVYNNSQDEGVENYVYFCQKN